MQKSIDDEFAELEQEIARITALPAGSSGEQLALLEALRQVWTRRADERDDDRPHWLKRVDEAIARGLERIVAQSRTIDSRGALGTQIRLDGETLKKEAGPVVNALLQGLGETLLLSLVQAKQQKAENPEDAKLGTPEKPIVVDVDWGKILGGVLGGPSKKPDDK